MNNFFICHRDYLDDRDNFREGGGDTIKNFLFKDKYFSLEMPLKRKKSHTYSFFLMEIFRENKKILFKYSSKNNITALNYFFVIILLLRYFHKRKIKLRLCLAIDPLSAFIGILCKYLFGGKVFFHITDYSTNRFHNFFLNLLYKFFFYFSFYVSDYVSAPSKKILTKFTKKNKNFYYIPNSPSNSFNQKRIYFKNNILLLTPKIDHGVDLNTLIDAILLIKNNFSDLKVFVCGNFVSDEQKKEYLLKIVKNKLENNIIFTGLINSSNDLNKLALNSSIGLTCYRRTKSHTYYEYGDSLKIRKYAYYGLPILSEGFTSTAHEARLNKCCFIYNNCKDLAKKIKYLLANKKKLRKLSINALNWHEKNKKILFLQKIILSVN